jgi:deoxyribose-phosphate aldolase
MKLEQEFERILDSLQNEGSHLFHSNILALSLIDLTLLDENATDDDLTLLQDKANTHQVAAICVYPEHLKKINALRVSKRATVVNFPEGNQPINQLLSTIEEIIDTHQPDEIDYVFPYQTYLNGGKKKALQHCLQAYLLCRQHPITFKVILETGALPSPETIYQLSLEIINNGCDFLKTSTGKISCGATPIAAFSLLKAIKDSESTCGIKVSGGIKKPEQAFFYMSLAHLTLNITVDSTWFRIGASSLLDELTEAGNNTNPDY